MAGLDHAALCAGGPDVSSLAWGSWRAIEQFEGPADLARFLGAILDIGITTLDAADVYGGYAAEAFLGKALAELGADAEQFEIITKCGIAAKSPARPEHKVKHYNSSAAHIRASAEASCRHLGRERIVDQCSADPSPGHFDGRERDRGCIRRAYRSRNYRLCRRVQFHRAAN